MKVNPKSLRPRFLRRNGFGMTELDDEGRSAATIVVVKDAEEGAGPLQFLMTERSSKMAFAGGALVFPGGAVDDDDGEIASKLRTDLPLDEATARVAAIRETLEEAGLGIGFSGSLEFSAMAEMRLKLESGAAFSQLLQNYDATLDLNILVPFARWHPRPAEKALRIYDTRFYIARAPQQQVASADGHENVRLFWGSADDIFNRCTNGTARIIFPTRRNLERLAQFNDYETLAAHAREIPVEKIRPWFEERNGESHLCIPTHLGYPVTSERFDLVTRS